MFFNVDRQHHMIVSIPVSLQTLGDHQGYGLAGTGILNLLELVFIVRFGIILVLD